MLDLLIDGDFRKLRKFWAEKMPHLPQPQNDTEAEIVMHQTRTMSAIPPLLRMWSHRWLKERNLPSMLPADMVAKADKLEVKDAHTVGIALGAMSPLLKPALDIVQRGMENKVLDAMSGNSLPSNEKLRKALADTYDYEVKKLLG